MRPNCPNTIALVTVRFAASGAKLVRLEFPKTEMQVYGNTIIIYTTYLYEIEAGGKRGDGDYERADERGDRDPGAAAARTRGRQIPFSGHCVSPCRRPKPQAFIIPTWHSEKSKRTGSTGSIARSDAVISAAIRHPGDA